MDRAFIMDSLILDVYEIGQAQMVMTMPNSIDAPARPALAATTDSAGICRAHLQAFQAMAVVRTRITQPTVGSPSSPAGMVKAPSAIRWEVSIPLGSRTANVKKPPHDATLAAALAK
jgi:hypothetical protein